MADTPAPKPKVFTKSDGLLTVGTWHKHAKTGDVKILCPHCTMPLSLGDHTIDPKGNVGGGVGCGCGWGAPVMLHGWGA